MNATPRADAAGRTIRFGPYCLHPERRVLAEHDTAVHLGHRALDILLVLVERAGEFVTNDEIVARVWPRTVVVEQNLRVHMSALRKALGDGRSGARYIINVPNRGYQFIAEVTQEASRLATPSQAPAEVKGGLPAPLHRIIGRKLAIQSLAEQIRQRRLVTVVGAGGIGKTTVALAVASDFKARAASGSPWNSVHFVDLAALADPKLVPDALATSLELFAGEDAVSNVIAYLHDKAALIVLDTCEHLVAAVAHTAEAILKGAPHVHILATSREPLRADGEWIQRLQALALPGDAPHATVEEALEFGAIELFVERASSGSEFEFNDADVLQVTQICRRLDGIPLAIELAAARVDALGVKGVAAVLNDSFALLSKGRRTAMPRQQTLEATLDWSYRLLSPRDQTVLLRLSAFTGSFTLDAAGEVAAWSDLTVSSVLDGVADLVSKSLIAADVTGEDAKFRLLDTTRVYAAANFALSADAPRMRRRHAEHCLSFLKAGEREWTTTPTRKWLERYGYRVNDVRAALTWCFSPAGDTRLGVALTAKAAPMLFQMSLVNEELVQTKRALDALQCLDRVDAQVEFELNILYGFVVFHTRGLHPDSGLAFARAREIAQETGDLHQLVLACSTSWMRAYILGESALMQQHVARFRELTEGTTDPVIQLMHERMRFTTLHLNGDQLGSRICVERILPVRDMIRAPFLSGLLTDQRVSIGVILTRTLWLLGFPLQANRVVLETLDVAAREGESVAMSFALNFAACPLAIWSGWHEVARQRVNVGLRHTAEHSLVAWHHYFLVFETLLDWIDAGAVSSPALPVSVGLNMRPPQLGDILATLHPSCADEATLERGDNAKAGWCQAELLRLRGERALAADPTQAESLFLRSLQIATNAKTLAWELRTSVSLGRLWERSGRPRDAYEQLESVLSRVQEGFSCIDFRNAVSLYRSLAGSIGARVVHFPDSDEAVVQALPDSFGRLDA